MANTYPTPELTQFDDGGTVPNNPDLPLCLIRGAMKGQTAEQICDRYEEMGWAGTWTYVVFEYHHYHHDAHEALCVATGWADIMLGGPEGQVFRLEPGDLIVMPAGTGHCRVGSSEDFSICGCYPAGQHNYTMERAREGARARHGAAIAAVPLPNSDPIYGPDGPLIKAWNIKTEGHNGA